MNITLILIFILGVLIPLAPSYVMFHDPDMEEDEWHLSRLPLWKAIGAILFCDKDEMIVKPTRLRDWKVKEEDE